ncbi:MAG: aldehyde dehydrogenase family protein [Bacteroidetes bacterium MedPE-SWsnd-G2]|nr:MAG: aldehyde dehydrogenase family protein [Bacteroidetes bacterium MedPE-SWsnd-G2]
MASNSLKPSVVFHSQKDNQYKLSNSTCKQRIYKLKALKKALSQTYKDQVREAMYKDFKKPFAETDLTEIYPVIGEIDHAILQLKSWMKPNKVNTPLSLLGSSSYYTYEAKGVCLILSPWNFPFNLTFGPLVSAIAAGNTVIVKPSEMTPNASKLMQTIVEDLFDSNEIALLQGGVELAQELLQLPFNHIFFTGSPTVGKIVMKAAAQHLSSVTLELGGKSPVVIDDTVNFKSTAEKVAWGKFINNGQVCLAPDYILVKENVKQPFLDELKNCLDKFYRNAEESESYGRIVNEKHFNRLAAHIENAKENGGNVIYGGETNAKDNFVSPTIITDLKPESSLLQDEIFGPILPIISFKKTSEAITYINSKPRPLALYVFSKSKSFSKKVLANTKAGSSCINHNVIQYSNHNLPFGGVNNSGIGRSHGVFGFQEFSNMRSVLKQHTKSPTEFLIPPYSGFKQKLIDFTLKWF